MRYFLVVFDRTQNLSSFKSSSCFNLINFTKLINYQATPIINLLLYIFFRFIVFCFRIMPFSFLYGLSNLLYFLLYKIGGYRKKVVRLNLKNSFPDKSSEELLQIEKAFYKHFFDILLEGIKGFSMSKEELLQRQKLLPPYTPQLQLDKGRSILIVGGHYGNWEWGGISASFHVDTDVIVLFSPIKNKYIDQFIKDSRAVHQTYFWSSPKAPKAFKAYEDKKAAFVLIADQSPSNPKRAHWLSFLNQDTAVLRGPASYAINYNIPLLFIDIQRVKRGYYTMEVSVLTENPQEYTAEELTELYIKKLEETIIKRPELWLWSHRRWKHQR